MGRRKEHKQQYANYGYGYMGFHGGHGGQVIYKAKPKLPSVSFTCTQKATEKLKFWIDRSTGEFGGFGVVENLEKPFEITDFALVAQRTGAGHADLDDLAVAKYYHKMVKKGLQPHQFGRIWFHTHGGSGSWGPRPSDDDDNTFAKAFGKCSWAVMLIFNDSYSSYAELYSQAGKQANVHNFKITVELWEKPLPAKQQKWADEFDANVRKKPRVVSTPAIATNGNTKIMGHLDRPIAGALTEDEKEYLDLLSKHYHAYPEGSFDNE